MKRQFESFVRELNSLGGNCERRPRSKLIFVYVHKRGKKKRRDGNVWLGGELSKWDNIGKEIGWNMLLAIGGNLCSGKCRSILLFLLFIFNCFTMKFLFPEKSIMKPIIPCAQRFKIKPFHPYKNEMQRYTERHLKLSALFEGNEPFSL